MFANLLSPLLLVLAVNSVYCFLVRNVQNDNVKITPISASRYSVRITHLDGSVLEEIVDQSSPTQYSVKGRLIQPDYKPAGRLIVTYKQGPSGYQTNFNHVPKPIQPVYVDVMPNVYPKPIKYEVNFNHDSTHVQVNQQRTRNLRQPERVPFQQARGPPPS